MRLAFDPYMLRDAEIEEVAKTTAELGYQWLELTPREDFLPYYARPRADSDRIARFQQAFSGAQIGLASLMVLYNWSDPDEEGRAAAVRYWRRAIEVAVQMGCSRMNSEFSGDPHRPAESEASFWRSVEELLPILESEGITVDLEPHPGDFVEDSNVAADMLRGLDSPRLRYLYCAPHTFHLGKDVGEMIRYCAPVLEHVHVADSYDHTASSGFRYIVNPADAPVRVHQHNVIGVGDLDWDAFFDALVDVGFDGTLTSCVLGWEDQALERSTEMAALLNDRLAASGLASGLEDFDERKQTT